MKTVLQNVHEEIAYGGLLMAGGVVEGGGGGRGRGTAVLKVGTHCQTTGLAFQYCPASVFFYHPPIFVGHRSMPPKNQQFSIKTSTKAQQ